MAKAKKAQKGASVDSIGYYKKKASDFQDSTEKYNEKALRYIDKMTPAQRKAKGVSKTTKSGTTTYKYKSGGKAASKKK